jgi:hypothetical protein
VIFAFGEHESPGHHNQAANSSNGRHQRVSVSVVASPRNQFHIPDLKAALVERRLAFVANDRMPARWLCGSVDSVYGRINAAFSPRGNAPSDQLAPDGRLPGMAAPTLDIQGEAR